MNLLRSGSSHPPTPSLIVETMPGYLKTILKLVLSALSLWLVFRKIDVADVWAVLTRTRPWGLVAATGCYLVSRVLGAERLRSLFAQVGLRIGPVPSLKLYWLGMYYNLFLPGGIGGDGYKVYLLNRLTATPVKPLVQATVLDRVIGLLPLLYGLLALLPLLPAVSVSGWVTFPVMLAGHWLAGTLLGRYLPVFSPVYGRATAQSMGVQGAQVLQMVLLLGALDAPGPVAAYLFIFLLSSVVSILPFTIGGAGARELTFLFGAQLLGLPQETAVGVSLLFYLITALVSLTGVAFSFRPVLSTNDLTT